MSKQEKSRKEKIGSLNFPRSTNLISVDIDDGLDDTEEPTQWWKSAPRFARTAEQGTGVKKSKEQLQKENEQPYTPKLSKEEIAEKFEQAEKLLKKETAKFEKRMISVL